MQTEKLALIEMMTELFRRIHHLSPIAAKILSILAIEGCSEGLTFESLIERLHASKSSLSTNIKTLLDKGLIHYEVKEGKRRKYFKSFPFDKRFGKFLELIRYEKNFTLKFIEYTQKQPLQEDTFTKKKLKKTEILLEFLTTIEGITEEFLQKIQEENK